ncbi:MAG: hypothetical protein L6Q99_18920 [Planctomycetes bacterium]|nr:hypothetical protein [Planctomycetota bacterium]
MNPSWTLAWLACASTALAGAGVRQQATTPQSASTPTVDDLFQPSPLAGVAQTAPAPSVSTSGGVSQPAKAAAVAPAAQSIAGLGTTANSLPGQIPNPAPSAASTPAPGAVSPPASSAASIALPGAAPRAGSAAQPTPAAPAIGVAPMPRLGDVFLAGPSATTAIAGMAPAGAASGHAPLARGGGAGGQHGAHAGIAVQAYDAEGVPEIISESLAEAPDLDGFESFEFADTFDEHFADELDAQREAVEELQAALEEQRAAFEASRRELLERQRELVERQREQRQRARELAQRANERARATRELERRRATQRARDVAPSCDTIPGAARGGAPSAPCPDSGATAPCAPCPPCPPCAPKAAAPAQGSPLIVRTPGSARVTCLDGDHASELAEGARRFAEQAGSWAAITVPGSQGGASCRVWRSADGEGQAWAFETADAARIDADEYRRAAEAYAARAHEFAEEARAYVWDGEELRALAKLDELGHAGEFAKLADLARLGELSTWHVDGHTAEDAADAEDRACAELAEEEAELAGDEEEDFDFDVEFPDEVEVDVTEPMTNAYYDDSFATQVPQPAGAGPMHELTALIREMSTEVRGLRDDLRSLRDDLRRDRGTR